MSAVDVGRMELGASGGTVIPLDVDAGFGEWHARLTRGAPVIALPRDRSRPTVGGVDARVLRCRTLEPAHAREAAALARRAHVPVRAVLLATFAAVLHRYAEESDLLLAIADPGTPALADRVARDACLVLTEIAVTDGPTFRALTQRAALALHEPAARVAPTMIGELRRSLSAADRTAIAHAGFGWRDSRGEFPATLAEWPRAAALDVALEARVTDGEITLAVDADAAMFDAATVDRMLDHLARFLGAALHAPDSPIVSIDLVTDEERALFAACNDTQLAVDDRATLVDLARAQAGRTPTAAAVLSEEGDALTYAALDARANRLGHHLRALGVGPDDIVAIYLERSSEVVVAVLGVHRAGGAYLPIDPGLPRDRIAFMLADAGAKVVLTEERLRHTLPDSGAVRVVSIDGDRAAIAAESASAPELPPDASRLAYLIYTSGSTGTPKGVEIEHRNVVNFLAGLAREIPMGPRHRILALTPLSFDIHVLELFHPLTCGAQLVMTSRETAMNPRALIELIERKEPTHIQATPSSWRMLIDAKWSGRAGLVALAGGEALPEPLARELLARGLELWNLYGPTEATVWATMQRCEPHQPVRIGRPMANVTAHVLDRLQRPTPIGIAGELHLGGRGLARGYRNRPELTAQRFIELAGLGRLYRTGDLARWRADGTLDFLGRTDYQVKVRGHRVELGEIEAAIAQHPYVRSTAVALREDTPGTPRLVGYVVVEPDRALTAGELRAFVRERVPTYMVPDAVVFLDELPRNANGKIDRKRLPAPAARRTLADGHAVVGARTPLEHRLVALWEEVLDVRPIGVTDDFFDLGATSITAARLFARIESELGARLPLSPLFQAPTVEKLATLLAGAPAASRWTSLVPIQPHGTRTPIFCVHGGAGTILHFQPLARRLGAQQPFYGLQMQGLYGDAPVHTTVPRMARHYLRELRTVQPHGPYLLMGYCFGGLVAFEMATLLERDGERVALLAVINAPTPAYSRAFGPVRSPNGAHAAALAPRPASAMGRALLALRRMKWALEPANLAAHAATLERRWRAQLILARTYAYTLAGRPLRDAWRERAIYVVCRRAERAYAPAPRRGDLLLFRGAGLYRREDLGWRSLVRGQLEVDEVPGEHTSQRTAMREPYVGFIADRLARALDAI